MRCFVLLLTMLPVGCGDQEVLHAVTGTVTLDGQPLEGATVSFVAKGDQPSNSVGFTDAQGRYTLKRTVQLQGIPAGTYRVYISTYSPADLDGDGAVPEHVPTHYNMASELAAQIKPGDDTFDFDLTSDGEIVQPDP